MDAGQQLRFLRVRRGITLRDVQQASRRIADAKADRRYCLSNGWLVQLESCVSQPNIFHLFALGAIYRVPFVELLRLYQIDVDEQETYELLANPQLTELVSLNDLRLHSAPPDTSTILSRDLVSTLPLPPTFEDGNGHSNTIYARLGANEVTMYPLIRPGSVLQIDTRQNRVVESEWRNEFERPIYFVELRAGYACGWCDLQGNQLRIVPYLRSPVREFIYPREAEIVGRVVGYYTPCVDLNECEHEIR